MMMMWSRATFVTKMFTMTIWSFPASETWTFINVLFCLSLEYFFPSPFIIIVSIYVSFPCNHLEEAVEKERGRERETQSADSVLSIITGSLRFEQEKWSSQRSPNGKKCQSVKWPNDRFAGNDHILRYASWFRVSQSINDFGCYYSTTPHQRPQRLKPVICRRRSSRVCILLLFLMKSGSMLNYLQE